MKKLLALLLLLSFSAHAGVGQWSSTDTSNNGAAPTGWPTGMSPADVKLTGRRMMSFTHAWYLDSQWVSEEVSPTWINTTTFTISTTDPTFYHANRRIKTQSAAGLVYSTISASTAIGATGASVTVVNDTGTISNTLFKVWFGAISAISPSITSATLGLQNLANPDNIISGTNSIKTFSAVNSISMTVNGGTAAYLNTAGLTVSGTGTYSGLLTTPNISATTALTSPLVSSTSNIGTISGTFGYFKSISTTTISGTQASLATNGFHQTPFGYTMQWGTAAVGANAAVSVTFPTAFVGTPYAVVCSYSNKLVNFATTNGTTSCWGWTNTVMSIDNAEDTPVSVTWVAIGT